MYQTEEQSGEKLQFDRASEEREEATEADKYSDKSGTDSDSYMSDELTRNASVSENQSLRMKYLDPQEIWCITVFICSGSG